MPANTSPIFVLTPEVPTVRITTATTASDGSGAQFPLITGGVNGTRIDAVRFRNSQVALAASTAIVHRIFYAPTSVTGSATSRLIGEVATANATRTTAAIGATSIYVFDQPLIMASGSVLHVCQSVYASAADQFDAMAFAGDY
jgi:hypothetical protein